MVEKEFDNFKLICEFNDDIFTIKRIIHKETNTDITKAISEIEALTGCDTFETLRNISKLD